MVGNCPPAALIADWISPAAASMSRLRSNCTVIELELSELVEVSSVTPAIKANCRSSGAVTLAAMVSALAPGSVVETWMVGKSTCGSGAIGSGIGDGGHAADRCVLHVHVVLADEHHRQLPYSGEVE